MILLISFPNGHNSKPEYESTIPMMSKFLFAHKRAVAHKSVTSGWKHRFGRD